MFDAAHAALFALGIEDISKPIKTHNGLVGKFGEYLARGNLVAAEHGSNLNKVQTLRELADYSGDPVSMEKAAWAVERAESFVKAVREKFMGKPPEGGV